VTKRVTEGYGGYGVTRGYAGLRGSVDTMVAED
jgi:hypothetical protein